MLTRGQAGLRAPSSSRSRGTTRARAFSSATRSVQRGVSRDAATQAAASRGSSSSSSSSSSGGGGGISASIGRPRAPFCGGGSGSAAWRRGTLQVVRSNIDDIEIKELVAKMEAQTPPLPAKREKLEAVIAAIDEINAGDPKKVPGDDGRQVPFRLAYSQWLTDWVLKLDPKACDELLILARGKSVESWRLSEIRRDDYAPNSGGQKMWDFDRKRWMAARLTGLMKDAGYEEAAVKLVDDVMMSRDVPNPRDMRLHDLLGPFGLINYRLLLAAKVVQTLADAEALLFLDSNFDEMFNRMPANEVEALVRKELSGLSQQGVVATMKMKKWSPVQEKLLAKVLPKPFRFNDILRDTEGIAASSGHPGDWRFKGFDYGDSD